MWQKISALNPCVQKSAKVKPDSVAFDSNVEQIQVPNDEGSMLSEIDLDEEEKKADEDEVIDLPDDADKAQAKLEESKSAQNGG